MGGRLFFTDQLPRPRGSLPSLFARSHEMVACFSIACCNLGNAPSPRTHGLRSSNSSDLERTFQMTRLHNVTGELHAERPWTSGDRQVQ